MHQRKRKRGGEHVDKHTEVEKPSLKSTQRQETVRRVLPIRNQVQQYRSSDEYRMLGPPEAFNNTHMAISKAYPADGVTVVRQAIEHLRDDGSLYSSDAKTVVSSSTYYTAPSQPGDRVAMTMSGWLHK